MFVNEHHRGAIGGGGARHMLRADDLTATTAEKAQRGDRAVACWAIMS